MLRLEVRNAARRRSRRSRPGSRPPRGWVRSTASCRQLVKSEGLHTVCQEAGCPNIFECWEDREATFLIGGDQCTRRCDFCQIDTGKPADFDAGEPLRVAESVQKMGLRYATVTGVCRDDLPDEGAWLYAETIRKIHELNPGTGVEMLAPDFSGNLDYLGQLFDAAPEVFAHNVETVPRIFKRIRPGFRYERSLGVLARLPRRRPGDQVQPDPRHGRDPRRGLRGAARPARRRHRDHHHHPVPAPLAAAPPGRALGQAGGVRRAGGRGHRDRLRRRDERPAGPLVLPRRSALPSGARVAATSLDTAEGADIVASHASRPDGERSPAKGRRQAGPRARPRRAKRAEKARKKASTDPADMGRIRQIAPGLPGHPRVRQAAAVPAAGAFLLPVVLAVVVGLLWDHLDLPDLPGHHDRGAAGHDACWSAGPRRPRTSATPARPARPRSALQMLPKQWVSTPVIAANRQQGRRAPHARTGRPGADRRGRARPGPAAAGQRGRASTSGSRTASR